MWKKLGIFLVLTILTSFLSSCSDDGPQFTPKKKNKTKIKQRETVEQEDTESLRKKLAPKTPEAALTGFFTSYKEFQHDRAYAYLAKACQKNLSKGKFLKTLGYESDFGLLINQCIQVQVTKADDRGSLAEVDCFVTLPNLFKISQVGDRIQHEWGKTQDALISDDQLEQRLMQRISKLVPLFELPSSFERALKTEESLLFSVDQKNQRTLDQLEIPAEIKKQFSTKQINLSKNAAVRVIEHEREWKIEDGKKEYVFRVEKKKINGYENIMEALRKEFKKKNVDFSEKIFFQTVYEEDKKKKKKKKSQGENEPKISYWKVQEANKIFLIRKEKKALSVERMEFRKEFTLPIPFKAILLKEDGAWWIDYPKTWKALIESYQQEASKS